MLSVGPIYFSKNENHKSESESFFFFFLDSDFYSKNKNSPNAFCLECILPKMHFVFPKIPTKHFKFFAERILCIKKKTLFSRESKHHFSVRFFIYAINLLLLLFPIKLDQNLRP